MKKLSKLDESIWADIHKRSNGSQIRKEDDIELLDMTGLYDYILAHYELTDKSREMTYGTHNMSIVISSDGDEILLLYGFHEVHLYFNLPKYKLLETELRKQFSVSPVGLDIDHYTVEQVGKPTNQFFIDVLDCIIANRDTILRKKDNVSESVWADIHKRSNGTKERKEDNPNLLDTWGFIKYLKKRYNYTSNTFDFDKETGDGLDVTIMSGNKTYYLGLSNINDDIFMDLSTHHSLSMEMKYNSKLYSELSKNFNTQYDNDPFLGEHLFIYPKDGSDVDFKFFVTVLDFLIDNIDNVKNISRK